MPIPHHHHQQHHDAQQSLTDPGPPDKAKPTNVTIGRLDETAADTVPNVNRLAASLWEGKKADRRKVPVVNGALLTEFDEPPQIPVLFAHMPPNTRRRWRMIGFALDYIAGRDARSFVDAGQEIGCSGVALFKAYRHVAAVLGVLRFYDAAVEDISEAKEKERAA